VVQIESTSRPVWTGRRELRPSYLKDAVLKPSERLRLMGFTSYAEYLHSPHWLAVKRAWIDLGPLRECFVCGAAQFDLHHRTYSHLGRERWGDIIPLCNSCHGRAHSLVKSGEGSQLWTAVADLLTIDGQPRRKHRIWGTAFARRMGGKWVTISPDTSAELQTRIDWGIARRTL
jgi:5-methylcytosine-specific restriction endonuclease McrA